MMSDKPESPGSSNEPNAEPPSSAGGGPEEGDRQTGESWFDRLRAAVGLKNLSFRRELEEALHGEEPDGGFSAEERTMLSNILRLRNVRVEDIMVPRTDVEAVEIDDSLGELIGKFHESGHSRMPVYRESLDEPVGMVHIKDLIRYMARVSAVESADDDREFDRLDLTRINLDTTIGQAELVRDVLYVPPSMPVATLLSLMQSSRMQMALVIDEYGGTDGLVSIEDTVETIVGEIEDEHDEPEPEIVNEGEGVFVADASTSLADVSEALGKVLSPDGEDDIETIGGKVFTLLGRIPSTGEKVTLPEGYLVEVLDADPRRIRRLRISPAPEADSGDGADTVKSAASGA
jgi:CBS domain containing-hemolysin-like protein